MNNIYDMYLTALIMLVFTLLFIAAGYIVRTINEESVKQLQPLRAIRVRNRK